MDESFETVNGSVDFDDEETLELDLGELSSEMQESTWEWDGLNWTKLH